MAYRIILSSDAEQDFKESVEWYENQKKGLSLDFILELNSTFQRITSQPTIFSESFNGLRSAVLRRFSFVVYFQVIPDTRMVLVLAIWHTSRNTAFLVRRG